MKTRFAGALSRAVAAMFAAGLAVMLVLPSFGSQNSCIMPNTGTVSGLTLVNVAIRDVPVGIEIDRGYGDWLWGKDVRFEHVRQAAVVISNENNVYTQIGFENALASDQLADATFELRGTRKVDGVTCDIVRITPPSGMIVNGYSPF